MIDPHVHLRDWKQADKETVAHGLETAKKCGFTHVFDMPNTDPPLTDRGTVIRRFALAEGIPGIGYHIWAGLTPDKRQIAEMVNIWREMRPKVVGLKLFMGNSTGNMGICGYETQRAVFDTLTELDYTGVLAVHAEKESLMRPEKYIPGRFETHSDARPPEAEIEAVRDAVAHARESGFKGTLHIAHVSTAGALAIIREAKKTMRVTCGITPHHALYTTKDARDHGRYLKMNPPLRDESDRTAVFAALLDGTADWIESDHAPHTPAQKEAGASGIPGLENMPVLIAAMRDAGASEERVRALTYDNAAKLFLM